MDTRPQHHSDPLPMTDHEQRVVARQSQTLVALPRHSESDISQYTLCSSRSSISSSDSISTNKPIYPECPYHPNCHSCPPDNFQSAIDEPRANLAPIHFTARLQHPLTSPPTPFTAAHQHVFVFRNPFAPSNDSAFCKTAQAASLGIKKFPNPFHDLDHPRLILKTLKSHILTQLAKAYADHLDQLFDAEFRQIGGERQSYFLQVGGIMLEDGTVVVEWDVAKKGRFWVLAEGKVDGQEVVREEGEDGWFDEFGEWWWPDPRVW